MAGVEINIDSTLTSMEDRIFDHTGDDDLTSFVMDLVRDMIKDLRASGQISDPPSADAPAQP
jgi:hypothetical protein